MKTVLHRAETRGKSDFGWLQSRHTFSFGQYHESSRNNFGVLRVLNDDFVIGGAGFGTHPHKNMEIISIPLEGVMEHKDSMGNLVTIDASMLQVMSAGTGISHSEYNKSKTDDLKFLQLWVIPNVHNATPRYDEVKLDAEQMCNKWLQVLSPNADDDGVWIYQNAWFYMADLQKEKLLQYELKDINNGLYIFLIEGEISVNGINLDRRDGVGFYEVDRFTLSALKDSKILLMELPLVS